MSKLSQLKQEAYQAGKKRNWDQAIALYEQILEKDKNNPTFINELGDLCLKTGDTSHAIRHFISAASKYRQTGLLNNAVAIYKKILRYDAKNLNAHWYLAETRAGQGLTVEGEAHAVQFLDHSGRISGDIKEIYLKRCLQLFELLPDSRAIQERLVLTFRAWSMNLESARAQCLVASLAHTAGEEDAARQMVEQAKSNAPEVCNYPEYQKWNLQADPESVESQQFDNFGSVELPSPATPEAGVDPQPATDEAPAIEISDETPAIEISDETPAIEISDETPAIVIPDIDAAGEEKDDEGCFSIDTDDGGDLEDLVAQASQSSPGLPSIEELNPSPTADAEPQADGDDGGLLDQLLSEGGDDLAGSDSSQLATITSEIGSVVGGEEQDPARLYEMGTVYLEMGLFDQACQSFEAAADDDEFTVRAYEMWGITLQRAKRVDDAIRVLTTGLDHAEEGSREQSGLRYHLARAHEEAGRTDEAMQVYREIKSVDPTYLDVGQRLKHLVSV